MALASVTYSLMTGSSPSYPTCPNCGIMLLWYRTIPGYTMIKSGFVPVTLSCGCPAKVKVPLGKSAGPINLVYRCFLHTTS